MMRRPVAFAAMIAVLAAGCRVATKASPEPVAASSSSVPMRLDSLILERIGGVWAPASASSRLTIARSGDARLSVGRLPGDATTLRSVLPPPTLDSIARHAAAIGFASLPPVVTSDRTLCPTRATDHGTLIVALFGAQPKRVEYYLGCYVMPNAGAPMVPQVRPELMRLRSMADAIDSLARTAELRKTIER